MAKHILLSLQRPLNTLFPGKNRIDSIPYGPDPLMTYDEYPVISKTSPIIIFWHGGSWKFGNKEDYRYIGHRFQAMGAHTFILDYPKFPNRVFPGFIDDALVAVKHIKNVHLNRQIILVGHSAGANTANLLGVRHFAVADKVISLAGVCTLGAQYWHEVFGDALKSRAYDPRTYINNSNNSTKFLIMHGKMDVIVSNKDSITFNQELVSHNKKSQLILVNGASHGSILPLVMFGLAYKANKTMKEFIFS